MIELHHMMQLGDMKVDVTDGDGADDSGDGSRRLFHRKLLEMDELDEVAAEFIRPSNELVIASRAAHVYCHALLSSG